MANTSLIFLCCHILVIWISVKSRAIPGPFFPMERLLFHPMDSDLFSGKMPLFPLPENRPTSFSPDQVIFRRPMTKTLSGVDGISSVSSQGRMGDNVDRFGNPLTAPISVSPLGEDIMGGEQIYTARRMGIRSNLIQGANRIPVCAQGMTLNCMFMPHGQNPNAARHCYGECTELCNFPCICSCVSRVPHILFLTFRSNNTKVNLKPGADKMMVINSGSSSDRNVTFQSDNVPSLPELGIVPTFAVSSKRTTDVEMQPQNIGDATKNQLEADIKVIDNKLSDANNASIIDMSRSSVTAENKMVTTRVQTSKQAAITNPRAPNIVHPPPIFPDITAEKQAIITGTQSPVLVPAANVAVEIVLPDINNSISRIAVAFPSRASGGQVTISLSSGTMGDQDRMTLSTGSSTAGLGGSRVTGAFASDRVLEALINGRLNSLISTGFEGNEDMMARSLMNALIARNRILPNSGMSDLVFHAATRGRNHMDIDGQGGITRVGDDLLSMLVNRGISRDSATNNGMVTRLGGSSAGLSTAVAAISSSNTSSASSVGSNTGLTVSMFLQTEGQESWTVQECFKKKQRLWCDSVGIWDGTPGVNQWCQLNCSENNCDRSHCQCKCVTEGVYVKEFNNLMNKKTS